jgi:DNA primase small subunit
MDSTKQLSSLQRFFQEFYRDHAKDIQFPPQMQAREYGFFKFTGGIVLRHIAFSSEGELIKFIQRTTPRHAYYSTAFYGDPGARKMHDKDWKGADLIFDIDADHFPTPCRVTHDSWECLNCGTKGKGSKPSNCPKCNGIQFKQHTWLCKECLQYAKEQVFRLVDDFLIKDFGISTSEMRIVFSGHRGYHIHVSSDAFYQMKSAGRREIVDYVMGRGIDPLTLGFTKLGSTFSGPAITHEGWNGRLARAVIQYIEQADVDQLRNITNWTTPKAKKVETRKATIIKKLKLATPYWDNQAGIGLDQWVPLAKVAAMEYGAKVDEPVTSDIHRLIRLPGSLHGKTGLNVKIIPYRDLEKYDPFQDSIAFSGEITVRIKKSPQWEFGNVEYEPMQDTTRTIEKAAGIYLIAQGLAQLVD